MRRYFNVNGLCYPDKHYMVDLSSRLKEIQVLIERGDYFVINRARQYGKTTLLRALANYLAGHYGILFLNFQGLSSADFADEFSFVAAFSDEIVRAANASDPTLTIFDGDALNALALIGKNKNEQVTLRVLFKNLKRLCEYSSRPLLLLIDEVDSASNYQVFLDFLAQLRTLYLERNDEAAFQSVILAGVYDIKNLKQKIRRDDEHRYNSPWNIAADFNVNLSFSPSDIQGMLMDYEGDCHTGMDVGEVAGHIYDYTSGYPYLVSRICKLMDERKDLLFPSSNHLRTTNWSRAGVEAAVKNLLMETNTLFDDMRKKIEDYPELRRMLYAMLFNGKQFPYNPDNFVIGVGVMFGFIKEQSGMTVVANRIFETRLYNLFLSEELMDSAIYQAALLDKNQFVQNGRLNMELIFQKFVEHFTGIYGNSPDRFVEENGRKLFLLYIKPIINGTGNYYVEARTRDLKRTDVIIDYNGQQYVIEMKIWRGEEYHRKGEEQLASYLDAYHLKRGYLLSFCFNKNKKVGVQSAEIGDKVILEAVV